MQTIFFEFRGSHRITVPDGAVYRKCVQDIMGGKCYPLPADGEDMSEVKSVVDLGAHAGEFTIMAALRWPSATVHVYEPNPEILPLLRENCRPYGNINVYPQAVDVRPRRDKLYFSDIGSVASTLVRPSGQLPERHEWAGVDVDIVGPEAVLAHSPDVLKLDIEGPESVVLAAMNDRLSSIHRIYVEYHNEGIRRHIDDVLISTHSLWYAHIISDNQGELMYLKKEQRSVI